MMKIAIMQPYFMPYIGYYQLMNSVDTFVVYDNIQFTKKGWINRNRVLVNGKDQFITIPLKKDSDYLNVNQRYLSDDFQNEKMKIMNKLKGAYVKAPFYNDIFPLIEKIFEYQGDNLFDFIFNSIDAIKSLLGIECKIVKSSELDFDIEEFKAKDKVIEICKHLEAKIYINPIGGVELYSKEDFKNQGIELNFIKSEFIDYRQFDYDFVPWLSIIDVLMFNSVEETKKYLLKYKIT
ncbi:hypothetical protein J2X31_000988 [Flavobacterium arsenatis]|uniref:WbqC-like protein n=1 Tax=Flavobacterium arsenatis TaxID=1484332 RepID=A0ABU1TLZ4_9FLAO|nr:WbqC family protein [Flavobacterium arsenatis]MDR6966988.1 hypothetical protein [Flavobacterium arsenatis]